MTNNIPEIGNSSNLLALNDTFEHIQEIARPIILALQHFQEAIRPLVETIEQCKPQIVELGRVMAEAFRPLSAIEKMGKVQFVYWDYMTEEFIDGVISATDTNTVLRDYLLQDEFKKVNDTIEKSSSHQAMKQHQRLYIQASNAFRAGSFDLAVTGFTAVFDGLLAEVSNNPTHQLKPRIEIIKKKLESEEFLDQDEYAMLTLALTFEKTVDSFSATYSFTGKEPQGLNRHWIAHGRSLQEKTELDCVKMVNLIYGLLLIEDLETV